MNAKKKRGKEQIPRREKIQALYEQYRPQYNVALRRVYQRISNLLTRNGINAIVKYRLKTFESYFEKLLRKYNDKSDPVIIRDILGFRIICPFLEDLDNVEKLITANFSVIEVEHKGSKHSFREFGYDSIHLLIEVPHDSLSVTIPYSGKICEIQLRTILQDAWAEVEYELIYKADFSLLNEPIKRKLASLNATLTLSDIIFQEIRDYQKEIQQRGEKGRESLLEKIQIIDQISILNTMDYTALKKKEYKSLITLKPKSPLEKLIFEALNAHSNGEFNKAVGIYSKILKMKPNTQVRSIIYNHRGMAYFILSEYQRSINDFSRAIEYNPVNFRAYNNRGLAYRMMQRYEHSLKDFNRSLEINAYQMECYYNRALTFFDLHDFTKALEDCEKALNIKPDFIPAQHFKVFIRANIVS